MTVSRLVIPSLALPAGANLYKISLVAAKGSGASTRSDTDSASIQVLAGSAPTGQIRYGRAVSGASLRHAPPLLPIL